VSPTTAPRREGRTRRLRRWVPSAAVLLGLALVTTGCQSTDLTRLGMPLPASRQGQVTLSMWQGSWIAAFCVGFVVWGGILWAIIFHRKRGDELPRQVRYNLPIEILYTVLPFIMIGVMFYFTARDESYITRNPAHPDVVVDVIAEQWTWQFRYPQYALSNPKAPYRMVTEVGQMWVPGEPASRLPLLEIPVNQTVRFNLTSPDVVHSFWVAAFEFKRQAVPGFPNRFTITPIRTGTFIGRCAELCGVYHSRMLFTLKIVTPAQFRQWIRQQQSQQNASGGAQ